MLAVLQSLTGFLKALLGCPRRGARIELRDIVLASDAIDAIEIMEETLWGSLYTGPDTTFLDRIGNVSGKSRKSKGARFKQERDSFMKAVRRFCCSKSDKELKVHELFSIADSIELAVEDTAGFIEFLNDQGDLLKKGNSIFHFNGKLD